MYAAAAGVAELAGGLFIALGVLGPMFVIATMIVAISVHWPAGYFGQNGGYELALLYALFGLAFAFAGFGAYSIDAVSGLQTFFTPLVDGVVVGAGDHRRSRERRDTPQTRSGACARELTSTI